MRERPSRYPHSPSTQENCLGITSHAETLQRAASIGKPIPHPGEATPIPCSIPAPRPTAPYGGRRGGRGAGVSDADTWSVEQWQPTRNPRPELPPPSTPQRGGRGGSGRGGIYRIGSYHAGMRTGSSRNTSSDQGPQHRSHRPAMVPKWHGVVPKRWTEKLAATPIVQAPTKLTSVPRRMPKLGSRRPASANQSHIPEKQLQSHGQ